MALGNSDSTNNLSMLVSEQSVSHGVHACGLHERPKLSAEAVLYRSKQFKLRLVLQLYSRKLLFCRAEPRWPAATASERSGGPSDKISVKGIARVCTVPAARNMYIIPILTRTNH